LFQEVREKRGLAYSISAFTSCQADHGLFGVYVGTGEKEAGEVTQIIAEETHKLAHTMTEDELSRAKTQMIAGVRMAQESVSSQSETLTRHVLCYGRAKPMAETIAEVQALSVEQLQENCKRIMQGLPTIAALGPVGKVPEYAALKSTFAA
jgi:predicted Zn-dependent peptidase